MADQSRHTAAFPAAPPLVGREREQAALRAALDAALAGRGSLVLIGGEAGLGKTALAEALLTEAASQGALALVGRCYDLSETPPYGPWAEALARVPAGLGRPVPIDLSGGRGVTSQAVLLAATIEFLGALAARRPLVLLLDDLHWADPASLDLLRALGRALARLPILLLATYRIEDLTRLHPLFPLLPLLVREAAALRLDLRALDDEAVRAWLGARYRLAEPHASLGYYYLYYDWDWDSADREFQRALALNPSYATAREWYSLELAATGRLDEAEAQVKRAVELDPLSIPIASTAGWISHYAGKQEKAERILRGALEMDSTYAAAHLYLGRVLQVQGRNREALAEYTIANRLRWTIPSIAAMGYMEAAMGHGADARKRLVQFDSLRRSQFVTAYAVALVYTSLGDKDAAFHWLDKAVDQRTHWLVWLNRDRRWDPLRADPRFHALVRRVGLPQ